MRPTGLQYVGAWGTHALTASGAVWGLLALISATEGEWRTTFVWLSIACAVDAYDGMLARAMRVDVVTPWFDGAQLDTILDYLNYVFVPAFVVHRAGLLPEAMSLSGAAVMCLASAYQFSHREAKTDDHYFLGFPSYWNIVAFYLFLGGLAPMINFALVVVLALFAFIPLKWIYPSRMSRWRGVTLTLTTIWGLLCLVMLVWFPDPPPGVLPASLGYIVYYVGVSLYLTSGDGADSGDPSLATPRR